MEKETDSLAPYRRFRMAALRGALLIAALATFATWYFNRVAAEGILLGSVAGIVGFWIIAVRLERIATLKKGENVQFHVLTWTIVRFILYGMALFRAFMLDRESMHGLLGAVAGIFIIRFVLIFMGVLGFNGRRATETSGDSKFDSR